MANEMKNREVPEQTPLPWAVAFTVSMAGMKRRLFRSLITMVGVVLAIAFLSYMLTTEHITKALVRLDDDELNVLLQKAGIDIFGEADKEGESTDEESAKTDVVVVTNGSVAGEPATKPDGADDGSTEPMMMLLLGLTLLTCTIGITNSMLMAVTERVREIGTLKCLGARDRFILKSYLIESSLQGVCGAVLGMGVGLVTAIAVACRNYGMHAIREFPAIAVGRGLVTSFLIGALMAVVASLLPAYQAARKQPVEALRVEE